MVVLLSQEASMYYQLLHNNPLEHNVDPVDKTRMKQTYHKCIWSLHEGSQSYLVEFNIHNNLKNNAIICANSGACQGVVGEHIVLQEEIKSRHKAKATI